MRAVVQRVSRAEVRVEGRVVGEIGRGLLVLVGIAREDTAETERCWRRRLPTCVSSTMSKAA